MATSSSARATDQKLDLIKQVKTHQVAIAELNHLAPSRNNLIWRKQKLEKIESM